MHGNGSIGFQSASNVTHCRQFNLLRFVCFFSFRRSQYQVESHFKKFAFLKQLGPDEVKLFFSALGEESFFHFLVPSSSSSSCDCKSALNSYPRILFFLFVLHLFLFQRTRPRLEKASPSSLCWTSMIMHQSLPLTMKPSCVKTPCLVR